MKMGMKNDFVVCLFFMLIAHSKFSTYASCTTDKQPGSQTVVVNCNYQDLTTFPKVSNEMVTELNIIFNRISDIRQSALSNFIHLTHLSLSHNLLREVNPEVFQGLWKLQSIDLSYNQLSVLHNHTFHNLTSLRSLKLDSNQISSLNPASFEGVPHLLFLDLGMNQLQELMNNTFCHLQELQTLRINANSLRGLEAGAFYGLNKLTFLDISQNRIEMSSLGLPPRVFAPLGKLEDLHIVYNNIGSFGSYPDHVFSDLVSLRRLTIDTFSDMYFGQDFSALQQIETLDLTDSCGVNYMSNNSLEGFKNSTLSELRLNCPFLGIELCAFCHLPGLKRLMFYGSQFTIPTKIMASLYGLQYQTMSEIALMRVGQYLPMYHVLDYRVARYIRNICVSTVKVVNCNIGRVTGSSLIVRDIPFTRCIEHVDLSQNSLIGDFSTFIQVMTLCPRLRTLSLQDQHTFTFSGAKCLVNRNSVCKRNLINDPHQHVPTIILPCSKNLTYVNISSVLPHVNPLPKNITFGNCAQLRTLDVSYIGLATCRSTLNGVENLETFSLEGNVCDSFEDTAVDLMPRLRKLSLSSLVLDQHFMLTRAKRVFQKLVKLQVLDLSFNNLVHLSPDMLQTQTDLRELYLVGNRLQSLSMDLQYQRELRRLDLSKNMLITLTLSERQALDQLAGRHQFRLLLQGNPLACSCFNLDLVLWLWHTPVLLDGRPHPANYTCTTETGETTSTEQVMVDWLGHWRRCVGEQIFSFAVSAFLVQVLCSIIVFFVSRSWTQLYYAWRAVRGMHLPRRDQFWKDAYLVYADMDDDVNLACVTLRQILEDRYDVRLLLRNRDEVGGHVAENIVKHIDDSWKVVLLVTRTFSEDDWACGFAVTQAQRSITAQMPDRVIVLFFEDPSQLPAMPPLQMLLRMVLEKNVLYIRPGTPPDHAIWKLLAEMILDEPMVQHR